MAIAPNTTFVIGQVLTAAQANAFPFGNVALASSATSYTMTTAAVQTTGMTVSWTAIANRNYKVTYYEPQVTTPSTLSGYTTLRLYENSVATGPQLQQGFVQNSAAVGLSGSLTLVYVGTFTAGTRTVIGAGLASSVTGVPIAGRSALSKAFLLVEDLGPA
jgi:hypothetical protein